MHVNGSAGHSIALGKGSVANDKKQAPKGAEVSINSNDLKFGWD